MKLDKREAGSGNQMPRLYQLSNLGYLDGEEEDTIIIKQLKEKLLCSLDFFTKRTGNSKSSPLSTQMVHSMFFSQSHRDLYLPF